MDSIVSNASPLIYLAKANQLSILMLLVDQVLIPEAVYKEVVLEGKQHGQKDAFLVEKAIQDGRITVRAVQRKHPVALALHPGEVEVISLAIETGVDTLLMDDAKGRMAAQMAGLKPRGTVWILLEAVKGKLLSFDEFLTAFDDITRAGFYLRENLYTRIVREAKKLAARSDQ